MAKCYLYILHETVYLMTKIESAELLEKSLALVSTTELMSLVLDSETCPS